MDTTLFLTLAGALVTASFGCLTAVIAWVGTRMWGKQDDIINKINDIKDELHHRISGIDQRVTRVETLVDTLVDDDR